MHSSYLIQGLSKHVSNHWFIIYIMAIPLQENDEHVLKCIRDSKVLKVFVSIFGDPDSAENQTDNEPRSNLLSSGTSWAPAPRNVMFYDATSVGVWG